MMQLFPRILKSASSHGSEPMLEADKPPSMLLSILLVLLIGLLFVVGIVAYQVLEKVNNWHHDELAAKYVNQALVESVSRDKQRLTEYRKNESGTYTIDIERAKALIAQRASARVIR